MKRTDNDAGPRPCIRVKPGTLIARAARIGIEGDTAIARTFGVGRSTAWRVLHHGGLPPVQFIAGALATLPGATFEDLFEVVPDEEV